MRQSLRNYFIDLARWYLHRHGWLTVSPFFRGVVLGDCVAIYDHESRALDAVLPENATLILANRTILDYPIEG